MRFFDAKNMFHFLKQEYKTTKASVDIATYGMYLGISNGKDWQKSFPMVSRDFIDSINKEKLRIVIGVPYYIECKPNCEDCKRKYNQQLDRINETVKMLNLDAKFSDKMHWKYYSIGKTVVCGGINLSDSDYADSSFTIDNPADIGALKMQFEMVWAKSSSNIKKFYR